MSEDLPIVSDHAVLRWMERVEGYDIERLRAVITVLGRHHRRRDLIGELEIEIDHAIAAQRKTGRRRR